MATEKRVIKKRTKARSALKTREGSMDKSKPAIVSSAKRVIKDSPVRGKFSRREIRAAVEAVARRHRAT